MEDCPDVKELQMTHGHNRIHINFIYHFIFPDQKLEHAIQKFS